MDTKEEGTAAPQEVQPSPTLEDPAIDLKVLDQAFEVFMGKDGVKNAAMGAIRRLVSSLAVTTPPGLATTAGQLPTLRAYLIMLMVPCFMETDQADTFRLLCRAISRLPREALKQLATWIATLPTTRIETLVATLQQYITVRWFLMERIQDVAVAVQTLAVVHDANEMRRRTPLSSRNAVVLALPEEPIRLPYHAFYNEAVNAELNLREDYRRFRSKSGFAFAQYPFVLDPASKSRLLQIDGAYQMSAAYHDAIESAALQMIMGGGAAPLQQPQPYLILRVRRDHLVSDSLERLQLYSSDDFKKPLKVQFEGEEGIDEGGVKKEFFQLIVQQLFKPEYGMFVWEEESRTQWFNPHSLETSEFELIGILLGLAIYNAVILDVRFPLVLYKLLLGQRPTLEDLKTVNPSMAKGLEQLLVFDGDVQSTYMRTFAVEESVFGESKMVELKKDGKDTPLTRENREEYVKLYVDYLLDKSVAKQYRPFESGFLMVCNSDLLRTLRPEELELVICGSPDLDFVALQQGTQYEEPLSPSHRLVKDFWAVVHEMKLDDKKNLLSFCTGSDRVPIKGLSQLRLTISRNGPDSDRLPTSHTCFNHLLLPEYANKEKLRKALYLAIQNARGFGLR